MSRSGQPDVALIHNTYLWVRSADVTIVSVKSNYYRNKQTNKELRMNVHRRS